jgi:RNA polymerase sigma-70 factor (ECF subfamily)
MMAGKLYTVCKRYLKNDEDIEEVLADSFYKIFTKMNQLHNPDIFEAWAKKIAVNECLQKLRSTKELHISLEDNHAVSTDSAMENVSFEKDILSLLNFLPGRLQSHFQPFCHRRISSQRNCNHAFHQ